MRTSAGSVLTLALALVTAVVMAQPVPEPTSAIPVQGGTSNPTVEDPHALAGLQRLAVDVEGDASRFGVSADGLEQWIAQRCRAQGLEVSSGSDLPELVLRLNLSQNPETQLIIGEIVLLLRQPCTPVRAPRNTVLATTWTQSTVLVALPDAASLQTLIGNAVDSHLTQFLVAHAQANPAPLSRPRQSRWWIRWIPFVD